MKIQYSSKRIENLCTDFSRAKKEFSERTAKDLHKLINFIEASSDFESVRVHHRYNFHQLQRNMKGYYSLDIGGRKGNYRLIVSFDGVDNNTIFNNAKTIKIIRIKEVMKHDDYRKGV